MPHPEVVYGGTVRPPLPQAVTASGRQGHQISARFWKGHGGVGTRGSRKGWCRLRDTNTRPSHYECDALPTELRRQLPTDHPACARSEERRIVQGYVYTCRDRVWNVY